MKAADSLKAYRKSRPVFLKVGGIAPLGGDFEWQGGRKKQRGRQGGETT